MKTTFRRSDWWLIVAMVAVYSVIGAMVWFTSSNNHEIHQHRIRNEMYHHVLCERQGELAKRQGVTLPPCPPPPSDVVDD